MSRAARGLRWLLAASLVVAVAACGSDDTRSSETTVDPTESAASPSVGCERPDDQLAGVGRDGTLKVDGVERRFSLEVPDDGRGPLPLVVVLHGALMTAEAIDQSTGFPELGTQRDFIVLTPEATGSPPIWKLDPAGPDVAYVETLIDDVTARLCVDVERVYLAGFSMGGMMSMILACRHPERYAAIATVAGVTDKGQCDRSVPVPMLAFHGTADRDVRFDGSYDPNVAVLVGAAQESPRTESVRSWASSNGCSQAEETTEIPPDVDHEVYACPSDGAVEFYVVEDGGHTWPGSTPGPYSEAIAGRTTNTIDATELIWAFFERHTRG